MEEEEKSLWLMQTLRECPGETEAELPERMSCTSSRQIVAVIAHQRQRVALLDVLRRLKREIVLSINGTPQTSQAHVTTLSWVTFPAQSCWQLDEEVDLLLLGTSSGHIQLHSSSGECILRQRVHTSPIINISVRGSHQGMDADDSSEELAIGFRGGVARIHTLEVLAAYMRFRSDDSAMRVSVVEMHLTKWVFPKTLGERRRCILLGNSPVSLYRRMADQAHPPKVCIFTTGRQPALALFEGPEFGGEGILAAVSDLASGLHGLAKTLTHGRPNGYRAGLSNLIGRSKPQPAVNITKEETVPSGHPVTSLASFEDEPRIITMVALCPRKPLAAVADNLGRVMVVDCASCLVITVWKAYRRAQLAWLSLAAQEGSVQHFLVIYAPSRLAVEFWSPTLQQRHLSWPCSHRGILLTPSRAIGSPETPHPLFLDLETDTVENLHVRFRNSLEKIN